MFWDVHCHLTDSRWADQLPVVLAEAGARGIDHFLLGGYEPEEWQRQLQIIKEFPQVEIQPCFGLHPMWVSQATEAQIESGLDQLAKQASQVKVIGEIGLDARDAYRSAWAPQMEAFRAQLELAGFLQKPVALHVVRAHSEALQLLRLHREWLHGGFVHAFGSGIEVAKQYLDYNLALSIGGAITHDRAAQQLREVIRWLPKESLLLETDSPDQKIKHWPSPLHRPVALLSIAEVVARIRGETAEAVLEQSAENIRRILKL